MDVQIRALLALTTSAVLAGCASGTQTVEDKFTVTPVAIQGPTGAGAVLPLKASVEPTRIALDATLARAWPAALGVYATLRLPLTTLDSTVHIVGFTGQRVARIDGRSVASFFECAGAYGNLAASGDVYVTFRLQVVPAGPGAQALIQTDATARAASSAQTASCRSTGALERLVRDRLLEALKAPAP